MRHLESQLQQSCVKWFRYQYPQYAKLLIAIPNGGKRNIREAARLKSEGVVSGVADLLLLVPKYSNSLAETMPFPDYTYLAIEMKTDKGKQTENQIEWQKICEENSGKYIICRSLDEFINEINNYLS